MMKKNCSKKNTENIKSIKDIPIEDIRKGAEPLIRRMLKGYYTNLFFKLTKLDCEELEFVVLGQLIDENNVETYSSWNIKYNVRFGHWEDSGITKLSSLVSSILQIHSMETTTTDCNENTMKLYFHAKPYRIS